jgi:hypothetical protein
VSARRGSGETGLQPFETATIGDVSGAKLLVTGAPARRGPAGIAPMSGDMIGFLIGRDEPGDANDVIETAHAFPGATVVGAHNHGWAHFAESPEDLAAAFSTLRIAERLGKLEAGEPTRFAA